MVLDAKSRTIVLEALAAFVLGMLFGGSIGEACRGKKLSMSEVMFIGGFGTMAIYASTRYGGHLWKKNFRQVRFGL